MADAILDLRPHLLLGKNGAQTKRVGVRHGDYQAHGNHMSFGNEVIFIDLYKGIHDDENNVWL